jgi:hypothetical protein
VASVPETQTHVRGAQSAGVQSADCRFKDRGMDMDRDRDRDMDMDAP